MHRSVISLAAAALLLLPGAAAAKTRPDGSTPAGKSLTNAVTKIKPKTFNAVGAGNATYQYLHLVPHGKVGKKLPLVLAEDAAWCPDCVATSWPLAITMSRFGSLKGLGRLDSGTVYNPTSGSGFHHTKGLSFWSATYASRYVRFEEVTVGSNKGKKLDKPSKAQQKVIKRFSPDQALPSIALGNIYGQIGAHFPLVDFLAGKSWNDVQAALKDPKSPLAQTIIGQANVLTAALCKQTKNKPKAVCNSKGVKAGAKLLPTK